MRPKRPEHRFYVIDRMRGYRQTAHDDDAAALLDVVEYPLKIIVEPPVVAVVRADLAQGQPSLADPKHHIFERGDLAVGQVE